jgi:hypothetical protein
MAIARKLVPSAQGAQVGILAGIANLLIYQHFMPSVSDLRTAMPYNDDAEKAEREALFLSIAATAIVATAIKSWDTFIVGGAIIVGIDFAYKHANAVHPATGKMDTGMSGLNNLNLPDYSGSSAGDEAA